MLHVSKALSQQRHALTVLRHVQDRYHGCHLLHQQHHHRGLLHGCRHVLLRHQHLLQARTPEQEELLWKDLFSKPSGWVDYRRRKRTRLHPDFRHKQTKTPLWLNSMHKPHWVDRRLAVSGPDDPPEEVTVREFCDKGYLGMAMDALSRMDYDGFPPSDALYITILKACYKYKALPNAIDISARVFRHKTEICEPLKSTLIITLAKCGGLVHACNMLHILPCCSVNSWIAVIDGFVQCGRDLDSLLLFAKMQEEFNAPPSHQIFASLLRACTNLGSLEEGMCLHAVGEMMGFTSMPSIGVAIVNMYSKCESILEAEVVFHVLLQEDVLSWNAMLSVYLEHGLWIKAILAYRQIQEEKWAADALIFRFILQACGFLGEQESLLFERQSNNKTFLEIGRAIHALVRASQFATDISVRSTLMMMYAKCGSISEALNVFEGSSELDITLWNTMLSAHVQQGQGAEALLAYTNLCSWRLIPDVHTFTASLRACIILMENEEAAATVVLEIGETLFNDAQTQGCASSILIGNTLLSMYGKCGDIIGAENVFSGLAHRDTVSWNAMLSVYVQHGQPAKAFLLFRQMVVECETSNVLSYVLCLQACNILADHEKLICKHCDQFTLVSIQVGRSLHADAKKLGLCMNTFITNSLISMYGKCASLTEVESVFNISVAVDVVTWNAMLSVYVELGKGGGALQLFCKMLEVGDWPNKLTYVIALQACIAVAMQDGDLRKAVALAIGRALHTDILCEGFLLDNSIYSILVSLYGKCGAVADAELSFSKVVLRNLVMWNAMLSSYVEQGLNGEALSLLNQIEGDDVPIDEITLVCALQVSSQVGSIEMCRQLYFKVVSSRFECASNLINTLIHSFGQCSRRADAEAVFFQLLQPYQVSWNAWIVSFAQEGEFEGSLMVFQSMQLAGILPDSFTYLSLLYACSHVGLVENSFVAFESMSRDFLLSPDIKHFSAMIDVLGRTGNFKKVEHLLSAIPMQANIPLWLSLLGACRTHGNIELAKEAFKQAMYLQPNYAGAYVLISNAQMFDFAHEQMN